MHVDVEAAWQSVVDGWEEPARHDALIGLVAQHGAFAWAAARYKERQGDGIADKQLERIRRAATATMFATASKKPETAAPYKRTIIVFVVLILMVFLGLVGVKFMHDTRPASPPATKPARH